ncbi:hypothetical protein E8D34_20540 [Nocardioides sp. GY 10113]|uniref:hypothetical protein n=1 Tax=Nocardioides sp. GY 10113 TaxID=2569761 RepID=UPI0010A8787B|nr:hypothetical protein [Nocardioides sp. GY 10113]TIC79160.1 hypothetical protein E8D34_20540 [Nocardioides sp. GY 10113]
MSEVPAPPQTGIEEVDAALTEVAELAGRPVSEHAEVFESAHAVLRATLDGRPPADAPSTPA